MTALERFLSVTLLVVYIGLIFTGCGLNLQKGHTLLGIVGIFFPLLWLVGAILPAKVGARFAVQRGNIATGTRDVTGWPTIVNLRAVPFERAPHESWTYIRWYGELLWLFVPVQEKLKEFFAGFMQYPYQLGSSLNADGINYQTLRLAEAQQRIGHLEELQVHG